MRYIRSLILFSMCVAPIASPISAQESTPAPAPAPARKVGHATLAESIDIEGRSIPLRGASVVRFWGFELYAVAHYCVDGESVIENRESEFPHRLVLVYHRPIKKSDFIESTEKLVAENKSNDMRNLRQRLDELYARYEDVKALDRYEITWMPKTEETVVALNGRETARIAGADFACAFMGLWLVEGSMNKKFFKALMAASPPR